MKTDKEKILFLKTDQLVESRQVYDGSILQLYVNTIRDEVGNIVTRELVHHQPAVAILAVNELGQILLVKQYRSAINQEIFEIPAGLLDFVDGSFEEALIGAKRELEEETGFQAEAWDEIGSYYLSPGYLDEKLTIFYARHLKMLDNPLTSDEDEHITLHTFNRDEIKQMMKDNLIIDFKTAFALNYWLNMGDKDE